MKRLLAVGGLVLQVWWLTSCGLEPAPPVEGERFTPPATYRAWWAETEACTGRTGSFDAVRWHRVPAVESTPFFRWEGRLIAGLWHGQSIFLSDSLLDLKALVQHEIVHALIQQPGHPDNPFIEPCRVRYPVLVPIPGAAR